MIRIEGLPIVKARLRSPAGMIKRLPSTSVSNRTRIASRPLNWGAKPMSISLRQRTEPRAGLAS